jgi:hypothetical protein
MLDEIKVLTEHEATQIAKIATGEAFIVHSHFSSVSGQVLSHMAFDGHHSTFFARRSTGSCKCRYS